jgi:hypothetical protein
MIKALIDIYSCTKKKGHHDQGNMIQGTPVSKCLSDRIVMFVIQQRLNTLKPYKILC